MSSNILWNQNSFAEHIDMEMEEIIAEIDQMIEEEEPLILQLQKFIENTSINKTPCEPEFLANLLRDAFYLFYLISHEVGIDFKLRSKDSELRANLIAKFLGEVLNECRRLQDAPDVFPSLFIREAFLTKIASLCSAIRSFLEIEKQKRSSLWHAWTIDLVSIELLGTDYPDKNRANLRSFLPKAVPAFHPDRRDAKNPWKNWLDNSAKPAPGWIAIQQKIPRLGEELNRKKVEEYDLLEASVDADQLLTRKTRLRFPP